MRTGTTLILLTSTVSAFTVRPQNAVSSSNTALYGLFDGVKDAFSAPPSELDAERETPIDRWMGWSVVSENSPAKSAAGGDGTSLIFWIILAAILPKMILRRHLRR